jgi:hypothetical protein
VLLKHEITLSNLWFQSAGRVGRSIKSTFIIDVDEMVVGVKRLIQRSTAIVERLLTDIHSPHPTYLHSHPIPIFLIICTLLRRVIKFPTHTLSSQSLTLIRTITRPQNRLPLNYHVNYVVRKRSSASKGLVFSVTVFTPSILLYYNAVISVKTIYILFIAYKYNIE